MVYQTTISKLYHALAAFEHKPSSRNIRILKELIVEYALDYHISNDEFGRYSTYRNGEPNIELNQIIYLFETEGCKVVTSDGDDSSEWWILQDSEGNQARLRLSNNPWSLESLNPHEPLTGVFSGYDNLLLFEELLAEHDIYFEYMHT